MTAQPFVIPMKVLRVTQIGSFFLVSKPKLQGSKTTTGSVLDESATNLATADKSESLAGAVFRSLLQSSGKPLTNSENVENSQNWKPMLDFPEGQPDVDAVSATERILNEHLDLAGSPGHDLALLDATSTEQLGTLRLAQISTSKNEFDKIPHNDDEISNVFNVRPAREKLLWAKKNQGVELNLGILENGTAELLWPKRLGIKQSILADAKTGPPNLSWAEKLSDPSNNSFSANSDSPTVADQTRFPSAETFLKNSAADSQQNLDEKITTLSSVVDRPTVIPTFGSLTQHETSLRYSAVQNSSQAIPANAQTGFELPTQTTADLATAHLDTVTRAEKSPGLVAEVPRGKRTDDRTRPV